MYRYLVVGVLFFNVIAVNCQKIDLINPSFEGAPTCCKAPTGWTDCGWVTESPPDIQPASDKYTGAPMFNVTKRPYHGNTYVGMVARQNETYERIGQKLSDSLVAGQCYSFTIYLCKSPTYVSALEGKPDQKFDFTTPIVLRIWGGNAYCNQKELLAESEPISDTIWKKYELKFQPKTTLKYFELDAFYKVPVLFPYNGNILLDNAGPIVRVPCPNEVAKKEVKKETKKPEKKTPPVVVDNSTPAKEKILKNLEKNRIKVGQTIQIEQLFFQADTFEIQDNSYPVLNEIYDFLSKNLAVTVEIGGHTNNIPDHKYCDQLSSNRARAVAEYLVNKGIEKKRVLFKGYGKRNPVATNTTREGRQKNQRVEIKILSIES